MGKNSLKGHSVFRKARNLTGRNVWDRLWEREKERVDVHPELIDLVKRWGGRKVLEVGFGTGGDLCQLVRLGYKCTGLESSRVAIDKARRILPQGVRLFLGRDGKLPFKEGQFETVFHQGVMEHFKDPRKFLSEQRRVLKKDGVLIIDVPHKWNPFTLYRWILSKRRKWYVGWERSYSEREIRETLYRAGFEVSQIVYRGIWPHQWGKFIYPEKIVQKKWITEILVTFPFVWLSKALRWLYENVHFIKVLSSYNVTAVGRRRPVRVVIDGRFGESGGGIGRYIREVIKRLPGDEYLLTLVSTKKLVKDWDRRANTAFDEVVMPQKLHWLFWEQVQLPVLLKSLRPDVYHAAGNWGVPIFCPSRVVLTIHDIIPLTEPDYFSRSRFPWLSKHLYFWRIWIGLWRAKRVVFGSGRGRLQVQQKFGFNEKACIIPFGVSDEFFEKKQPGDEKILKRHGVYGQYIINPGGVDPRKNLERLIEAFRLLVVGTGLNLSTRKSLKLAITGEGSMKKQLKDQAQRLSIGDRVVFPGWVTGKDLAVLVRNARAVVYPTLAEGFGMPLLEGMAVGVPVVASKIPVLQEIGGAAPIYVNPLETENITRGMAEALSKSGGNNKRVKKGKEIARGFTWERNVRMIADVYSDTLGD